VGHTEGMVNSSPLLVIIAENLRKLRQEAGLSQAEVGRRAGVTGQMISHIETRQTWPSVPQLAALANALGVPLGRLLVAGAVTSQDKLQRANELLAGFSDETLDIAIALLDALCRTSQR
jgi:transcriptional regulator with XRE-family HTH domain